MLKMIVLAQSPHPPKKKKDVEKLFDTDYFTSGNERVLSRVD